MKTTATRPEVESEAEIKPGGGKVIRRFMNEVAKQFLFELLSIYLLMFWAIVTAWLIVGNLFFTTWSGFPVTGVLVALIVCAAFAVLADSVNSFFNDDSLKDKQRLTEEYKRTAFRLTLIPLVRELLWRLIRIIRHRRKPS